MLLVRIKNGYQKTMRLDYSKAEILIHIDSDWERYTRTKSCRKEPDTIKWIENFIKPGDVVFDVGANIGAYSLVIAKASNNEATVYAFEPSWPTYIQLCRNIVLNKCESSVYAFNLALSSSCCLDDFCFSDLEPGSSAHALGAPVDQKGQLFKPVIKQRVLASTIDKLVDYYQIELPSHIKLDVDGIELEILKGAEKTLRNPNFKSVLVEINIALESGKEIVRFLESCGLSVHSKYYCNYPVEANMDMWNYIFIRRAM